MVITSFLSNDNDHRLDGGGQVEQNVFDQIPQKTVRNSTGEHAGMLSKWHFALDIRYKVEYRLNWPDDIHFLEFVEMSAIYRYTIISTWSH